MLHVRRCGKCNVDLGFENTTCPGCHSSLLDVGVNIEHTNRCPQCNALIHNELTSCRKCGAHFMIERSHWFSS